jgi:hypothetical protein
LTTSVNFLLDTNILIPAEPTSHTEVEPTTSDIVELLRVLDEGRHQRFVHPASVEEVREDRDTSRAKTRELLLRKYRELPHPPAMSTKLLATLGAPKPASNSETDLLILSSVDANAVDYLVTEDDKLHRRAKRVGLGDRVLTIADAILMVRALFPTVPKTPPLVTPLIAHQLNESDPIFASFRGDYPGFDGWLAKCKREHRRAWVVSGGKDYAAVCIVNDETPNRYAFPGRTLKICSFKIAERFRGFSYGELILKTVFAYLVENRYHGVFVEVFPKHQELFTLLSDFGFEDRCPSEKGERVLLKTLQPEANSAHLSPIDFHIRYGPNLFTLAGINVFVVPIRPVYHALLFPELSTQLALATESHPFGNSIRKAYLCHSKIRKIQAGDVILFYRSKSEQAVTAVGVAEGTLVSSDAPTIARFVGRRTVYPYAEIEEMATKPVLAVLFRLARCLKKSWELDLLKRTGIVARAPQSFMQVKREQIPWIAGQLGVPH